jgi:hypothetical protein
VDPVAVLAIFQEVGVNSDLYFIVFGESLLNDGVAVVLYNMMNAFASIVADGRSVSPADYGYGLLSFLTLGLGGLAVGVLMGGNLNIFLLLIFYYRSRRKLKKAGIGILHPHITQTNAALNADSYHMKALAFLLRTLVFFLKRMTLCHWLSCTNGISCFLVVYNSFLR